MKTKLTAAFRGDITPVKVVTLGYLLPMSVGAAVVFFGKPIQWGSVWPTVVLGLLAFHQAAMIIPLWRSAKGKPSSPTGVLARTAAAFAALMLLPLAILTLKATSLNCGDGSDCVADKRSAEVAGTPAANRKN